MSQAADPAGSQARDMSCSYIAIFGFQNAHAAIRPNTKSIYMGFLPTDKGQWDFCNNNGWWRLLSCSIAHLQKSSSSCISSSQWQIGVFLYAMPAHLGSMTDAWNSVITCPNAPDPSCHGSPLSALICKREGMMSLSGVSSSKLLLTSLWQHLHGQSDLASIRAKLGS